MSRRRKAVKWLGVVALALLLAGVAVAPSWRNYYFRRGAVRILEDRAYGADPAQRMDLYLPAAPGPWPVVVFVHGGFWKPLSRRTLQPFTGLHGCVGVALANRGVATAVIDYRQYPEAHSVATALDDITRAIRHVVDTIGREGGDTERVFVVGHSAGAMMTALLALAPEHLERAGVPRGRIRGFATLAGVYEQFRFLDGVDGTAAARVREVAANDGGPERFSPERLARADHPPMLLLVGDRDVPQLVDEHRHMAAALRRAGGELTEMIIPGEDHMDVVMHLSREGDRVMSELMTFIRKYGAAR